MPLRPERVVEVRYDYMEGIRFRHTAQFERWRPDREPRSCTYAQLERPVRFNLADVLTRIVNGHPNSQIDQLLPWAYADPVRAVA